MSDIEKLRAEIVGDPLERGYAAMTDAEVAASLNAVAVMGGLVPPASRTFTVGSDDRTIRVSIDLRRFDA